MAQDEGDGVEHVGYNPEAKVERKDQLEVVVVSFCRFRGHV